MASRLLLPVSMQTKQDHREPILLMALKIMLPACSIVSLSDHISYLCVLASRKKEGYARHCLVEGRGGKPG